MKAPGKLLMIAIGVALIAPSPAQSGSAAKLRYEVELEKLDKVYAQKRLVLQRHYLSDLKKAQSEVMRSGDLKNANAIQKEIATLEKVVMTAMLSSTEWGMLYLDKKMAPTKIRFFPDGTSETERQGKTYKTKWWIADDGCLIFTSTGGKHHRFPPPLDSLELNGEFPKAGRLRLKNRRAL